MKQVVIDTNIFIRLLTKDIKTQFEKAQALFTRIEKQEIQGLVSILVLNEIIWIAENFYNLKRSDYLPQLFKLLALKNLKITEVKKAKIIAILELMRTNKLDFTDVYLSQTAGTNEIFSFDRDIAKLTQI